MKGNSNTIRLNKFISESGMCSRREADKFIEQELVTINGRVGKIGDQVKPRDKVMVNGQKVESLSEDEMIIIAFNKPIGITSTTDPGVRGNIVDYVNHSNRIFPIGRLDKDSQGLILLTNNGDLVNKILRAGNKHEKEYVVTVDKQVTEKFLLQMSEGVPILDVMTKKCEVKKVSPFVFKVVIVQGMNRQIRRMCEVLGYECVKLERIRIMNVSLKGLPIGEWRELTKDEMSMMNKMTEKSVKIDVKEKGQGENSPEKSARNKTDHGFSKKPKSLLDINNPLKPKKQGRSERSTSNTYSKESTSRSSVRIKKAEKVFETKKALKVDKKVEKSDSDNIIFEGAPKKTYQSRSTKPKSTRAVAGKSVSGEKSVKFSKTKKVESLKGSRGSKRAVNSIPKRENKRRG